MAEFNLPESLKAPKKQEEKSPEEKLKIYANESYRQVSTAFNNLSGSNVNVAEREEAMTGWDRVLGVKNRASNDVMNVLRGAQAQPHFAGNGFKKDIWKSELSNSTIDAIRTGKENADLSLTVLNGCEKLLENSAITLLGGNLEGQEVQGELVRQQAELQEAKNQRKIWNRIKIRTQEGFDSINTGDSLGRGIKKVTGHLANKTKDRIKNGWSTAKRFLGNNWGKVALSTLMIPKHGLIGVASLGAAVIGGNKVLESKQNRYKGKLQEVLSTLKSNASNLKSGLEKQVEFHTHTFTGSFDALNPNQKSNLKQYISEEISGAETKVDRTTQIRALIGPAQAIADIPYNIRLEIYQQQNLDQTKTEGAVDQLSDNFDGQITDIDNRKNELETTDMQGIKFNKIIDHFDASYDLKEVEAPNTTDLINHLLGALPEDLKEVFRGIVQAKHNPEEQFLHICKKLSGLNRTEFRKIFDHLPHTQKAEFATYLKKLDSDSRNDYQQLGTPEEKESLEIAKQYQKAAEKIITRGKNISSIKNLHPETTFAEDIKNKKSVGIDGIMDYFNDDKSEHAEYASDEWEKLENTLSSLQSEYEVWKNSEKELRKFYKWQGKKAKAGDKPTPDNSAYSYERPIKGTSSTETVFDRAKFEAAKQSWLSAMGNVEYLEQTEMPETNWNKIEAGLEKVITAISKKTEGSKKEAPKGNERMYKRLYKQAEKAFEDEYLRDLKSKQKHQFDFASQLSEETALGELMIQESNPSFPVNRTEVEKNQLKVTNPKIYRIPEDKQSIVIKGTINGTDGLIVIKKPDGDLTKPNAAFYAETSLLQYDPTNPEPDHFDFPDQPNFAAISLNMKMS